MSTQNLTFTAGAGSNIDFLAAGAAADDKMLLVVYNNGGAKLMKRSVEFYGSADELAISAGVKYTAKFSVADVANMATGYTYTLKQMAEDEESGTVLFSGSVAVSGAAEDVSASQNGSSVLACRKTFTADGDMGVVIPAGSICLKLVISKAISNETSITVRYKNANEQIIDENTIDGGGAYVMDFTSGITSEQAAHVPTAQAEDLSLALGAWGSNEEITLIGVFVKVDHSV